MQMKDDELCAAALPLLRELVARRMLYGAIRQSEKGEWVLCTALGVVANGVIVEIRLEDDAASIASATFL
jgi:hypothetical protein